MGRRTSYEPGVFCWVELGSTDPTRSADFYKAILGWEIDEVQYGAGVYITGRVDGMAAAGIYTNPKDGWTAMISVEDCDTSTKQVEELGGRVIVGPTEADTLGRMSVVADPQGAPFTIWQPRDMFGAEVVNQVGSFTMTQLNTQDIVTAQKFYGSLFEWEFVDNGDGEYWSINVNGRLNAAMMQSTTPAPDNWFLYFTTASLEMSGTTINENGGTVVMEPTSTTGGHFLVAQDSLGAFFGLYEGEVDD